jgi:hypothetical protein
LFFNQTRHQRLIFFRPYAMIDTADMQQVQSLINIFRRAFFSGMCHRQQTLRPRLRKHALELGRRMPLLARIQAYANDVFLIRQSLI